MSSCVLIIGLQLYREIKSLTQAPSQLNCCISCRINDARRRRLQVGLGTRPGFSEDPINVAEDLTEAPNQSSEVSDIPAPTPTQEGKPWCITQYFKLLHYAILYLYIISCIKSRS
jgi:hypothetical protein